MGKECISFRLARMYDLEQIKSVYRKIIRNMNENQIEIWDDIYPCDFFEEDIRQKQLYVLLDQGVVVSAFALCTANSGAESVKWEHDADKALYLDRFGVNPAYARRGIGSFMLDKAKETAKNLGVEVLRLFVVDVNKPAIRLYEKNSFVKAAGVYDEVIDEELVLHEYGYETDV